MRFLQMMYPVFAYRKSTDYQASKCSSKASGGLTQVVADRGFAPMGSGAIFDNLFRGKISPEPNPPRQLNKPLAAIVLFSGSAASFQFVIYNGRGAS